MGEDSDQQSGSERKSGLFANMNAVIAGITGLLVAAGGLASQWDKMPWANHSSVEAASTEPAAESNLSDEVADDDSVPGEYDIDFADDTTGKVSFDGKKWWTMTSGPNSSRYEDSSNEYETILVASGGGEDGQDEMYKWPTKGGTLMVSEDSGQNWQETGTIQPTEE